MNSLNQYFANDIAKRELRYISESYANSKDSATRHKCFISYHGADAQEVLAFVKRFEGAFIPRIIGVTEEDPAVNSDDTDYVMDAIRDKYLADSTVTIVMSGACTWSRKFIDWEIYSSLRRDKVNRLNGLMGIQLPSVAASGAQVPIRLSDNLKNGDVLDAYARYWAYPTSERSLRDQIEDAFGARNRRDSLIQNGRVRKMRNSSCP
ncbi:TIR domain-containing protein [Streptomyces sp. NPDC051572]|uniref:TIR domain-containing protein n=1 Tax=Streptomyces sp. NPDC051572 TaxID=3155802 RepID=UPI00344E9A60